MNATTVHVTELQFQAGSSDKFYRTFTWADDTGAGKAVVQYGRRGTSGQVKATSYDTIEAAVAFAAKQVKAKATKGYQPVGSANIDMPAATLVSASGADLDSYVGSKLNGSTTDIAETQAADETARHDAAARKVTDLADDAATTVTFDQIVAALDAANLAPRAADTGYFRPIPQLAETVEASKMSLDHYLGSPLFVMQPKLDGDRFMVTITDGYVGVLNRQGQPKTTNITRGVIGAFKAFTEGTWVFDGEMVGRTLHLFDMAVGGDYVSSRDPFTARYRALKAIVSALDSEHIALVHTTIEDRAEKSALLNSIRADKGEGVIFRKANASYSPGTRGGGLVKHKFLNEADCYIIEKATSKESVTLGVRDADGNEVVVGKASTIGKGVLVAGDVVEVRFMHVLNPAVPTMVQPRIVRKRTDKAADECSIVQFVGAGTNKVG